jgi:hypothetical protein
VWMCWVLPLAMLYKFVLGLLYVSVFLKGNQAGRRFSSAPTYPKTMVYERVEQSRSNTSGHPSLIHPMMWYRWLYIVLSPLAEGENRGLVRLIKHVSENQSAGAARV